MNKVELIGRITIDPELRYTQSNKAYTRFSLAVNRVFKNEVNENTTDFINCIAWEKRAETICNYVKKGNRIAIAGRIQTGSYDKEDGTKGYTTDVVVGELEFLEYKNKENKSDANPFDNFENDVNLTDDDLPF